MMFKDSAKFITSPSYYKIVYIFCLHAVVKMYKLFQFLKFQVAFSPLLLKTHQSHVKFSDVRN